MIKLVITDLDGTFLNSQGSFDNYNEYTKGSRLNSKRSKGKKQKDNPRRGY